MDAAPALNEDSSGAAACGRDDSIANAEPVSSSLSVMGTLLVAAACFVSCIGTNLQKWSHTHNESLPRAERVSMYRRWRWWLGFLCMFLGALMDTVALPFVPMSRVAALGSGGVVANVIVTPRLLGEKLTGHDLLGGTIIVLGTTMTCYFGAGAEPVITSTCLLQYFTEPLFVWYAIALAVFCGFAKYLLVGFRRKEKLADAAAYIDQTLDTHWAHENKSVLRTLPEDPFFRYYERRGPQFYPSVYAVYAGTVGALSVMFSKLTITFLKNAIDGQDVSQSVMLLFLFLVPTVMCLLTQIKNLNRALLIYRDALFVLPVYQAVWVGAGIIDGLIFFQEYTAIDASKLPAFAFGNLLSFSGIIVLMKRKSKTPPRPPARCEEGDHLRDDASDASSLGFLVEVEKDLDDLRATPSPNPRTLGLSPKPRGEL
eukprot:TRINITY_DN35790_c0_g1_i1.p1 TRINITY_DN35790_c0_g1~~TRINITY_DN35790_c0_g1_i1.p1  ORF type:complete len:445 (+),score=83.40 TRINITY_DN35790_c0_g1_i1:54-1337(+)